MPRYELPPGGHMDTVEVNPAHADAAKGVAPLTVVPTRALLRGPDAVQQLARFQADSCMDFEQAA